MQDAIARWGKGDLCELTAADLDEREYDAVRYYTGETYKQTNGLLRSDEPMNELDAERSAALLSALMHPKARLKHDLTLYRRALVPSHAKVGETITDLGFMSCTVDFQFAKNWIPNERDGYKPAILKLQAKAGARGFIAPVDMTAFDNESEILRYGGVFYIISIVESDGVLIYNIQDEGGYEIK